MRYRQQRAVFAWLIAALLLLGGLVALGARAELTFRHPVSAAALAALSLIGYLSARRWSLPRIRLEADLPIWFVALVHCGGACALGIVAMPELLRPLLERSHGRPRAIALLANLASFTAAVLAGELVLQALASAGSAELIARWPAYALSCAAMVAANGLINPAIVHCIHDGRRFPLWVLGGGLALVPLAALIACLFALWGMPALAAFAIVACLPGPLVALAVPIIAPRATALDRERATLRYAQALARTLGLPAHERRAIRLAAGWSPPRNRLLAATLSLPAHFDAAGLSFGLELRRRRPGTRLTRGAGVLELARAWAELTAAGTLELSHSAALACLEAEGGRSSALLQAAWRLVDEQPGGLRRENRAPSARGLARRLAALLAFGRA